MPVQFSGEAETAYPLEIPCLYWEWAYGVEGKDGWETMALGYQSRKPLSVQGPAGPFTLPVRLLRPYLAPVFEHTYGTDSLAQAPEEAAAFARGYPGRDVTVRQYCLRAGHTYQARVRVESYILPPQAAGEKPRPRSQALLEVWEKAWTDTPPHSITPAFRHWSY